MAQPIIACLDFSDNSDEAALHAVSVGRSLCVTWFARDANNRSAARRFSNSCARCKAHTLPHA